MNGEEGGKGLHKPQLSGGRSVLFQNWLPVTEVHNFIWVLNLKLGSAWFIYVCRYRI